MKINNKKEFYDLFNRGILGNKALVWNSYEELKKSRWNKGVCIRLGNEKGRKFCIYDIPFENLDKELSKIKEKDRLVFNQSMPNKFLSLQGELMNTEKGLYLFYTTIKKPMNLGLKEEQKHAFGLGALNILKAKLYPTTLDDFRHLLEQYPDAVIEFSAYEVPVGNLPGRNAVIWEVRDY